MTQIEEESHHWRQRAEAAEKALAEARKDSERLDYAEALRALAAWSSVSSGRTVEWCCMECEWQCWLGTGKDYDLPVIGTGVSPAAASMDAISKAAAK